jgi:hypothetical protein
MPRLGREDTQVIGEHTDAVIRVRFAPRALAQPRIAIEVVGVGVRDEGEERIIVEHAVEHLAGVVVLVAAG